MLHIMKHLCECFTLFPGLMSKSSISPSCALKSNFFFRDGNCSRTKTKDVKTPVYTSRSKDSQKKQL